MEYALFIHESPDDIARRDGDDAPAYWAGWQAYTHALREAGVLIDGRALEAGHAATTIGGTGAARTIHDGPFADARETLGGYYVLRVASLDEALAWADRCPAAAHGRIELRPVRSMPDGRAR